MAERKSVNRYYPPDYDPNKIQHRKKAKGGQLTVRLAAPYSMRCTTCGEFIYKGKKFNARKEFAKGEDYLGIRILRFYIRCPHCTSEITFKTDPKNTDYAAEHGATRNYEPWRQNVIPDEEDPVDRLMRQENGEEEDVDPVLALEQRQQESQREMEIMDALQEIRARNARLDKADTDTLLQSLLSGKRKMKPQTETEVEERRAEEEDEEIVRRVFRREVRPDDPESTPGRPESENPEPDTQDETDPKSRDPAHDPPEQPPEPSTVVVKQLEGEVPAPAGLLSEGARDHLASLARPKGAAKRRRQNALGVVQKRV